ncbi:uncharacterized protein PRCAT00001178001 [Priceomyces carsonii]|uniref:uncharacterized protein n=1 Tax=Priceomyces carsonii TaxID=28549 RepID=UPI002ED9923F|nr:unnamed protein product [Priceomyces carsonii]
MEQWKEFKDDLGRVYYYNEKTQETSWSKPSETALKLTWQIFKTDEGTEYYYNEETGETTWDKPAELQENSHQEKDEKDAPSESSLKKTDLELELESKPLKTDELINPSGIGSFQDAEESFIKLLKDNGVDSTWSFQAVISKFIKNPVYWAIPDSLHKRKLFEGYLVSKIKEEHLNKAQVVKDFENNFLDVLNNYYKLNKMSLTTRWRTFKQKLIEDDNPIFNHAIVPDSEIYKIYDQFVSGLERKHNESISRQKEQALSELETYLISINPSIVSDSSAWQELYNKLQDDPRFTANKHFTILDKLDILELYEDKIYSKGVDDIKEKIRAQEKINYRSDRKARENFKNTLNELNITANSSFKEFFPILEQKDSFIEICGRNGSTPSELFWDIVDEKKQTLQLKSDLVEGVLVDLRKIDSTKYHSDVVFSSKESFIDVLREAKDERLSILDLTLDHPKDNDVEFVFEKLKSDSKARRELEKERYLADVDFGVREIAQWLYKHYKDCDFIHVVADNSTDDSKGYLVKIILESKGRSVHYTMKDVLNITEIKKRISHLDRFRELERTINNFYDSHSEESSNILDDVLRKTFDQFIDILNQPEIPRDTKRTLELADQSETKRRRRDDDHENGSKRSKQKLVLLNY